MPSFPPLLPPPSTLLASPGPTYVAVRACAECCATRWRRKPWLCKLGQTDRPRVCCAQGRAAHYRAKPANGRHIFLVSARRRCCASSMRSISAWAIAKDQLSIAGILIAACAIRLSESGPCVVGAPKKTLHQALICDSSSSRHGSRGVVLPHRAAPGQTHAVNLFRRQIPDLLHLSKT